MATKKTQILIADDNPNIRQTLTDILVERGYAVESVSDGYELLNHLRKKNPDVLILDLIMPQKDGFEVFSTVKGISPSTKIIIYTGFQRYEYSLYAKSADKFLLKSESPKKLLEAIEEMVS